VPALRLLSQIPPQHASAHHGALSPQVPALRLLSQIPPQHASAHHGVLSPQVPALRLLSQRTDVVLYDMYVPDDPLDRLLMAPVCEIEGLLMATEGRGLPSLISH
jgi:hypothetical protein